MKTIHVGNLTIDGSNLFLIAGPCVIEGYDRTLMIGREIKKICERLGVQYIFKASFDKANRSSYHSFRGPGLEKGLEILADIKKEFQNFGDVLEKTQRSISSANSELDKLIGVRTRAILRTLKDVENVTPMLESSGNTTIIDS